MYRKQKKLGRKPKLDHQKIQQVLIDNRDSIILGKDRILSQDNDIWKKITKDIGIEAWIDKPKQKDAYSYVTNNVRGIREKLCPTFGKKENHSGENDSSLLNSLLDNSTCDELDEYNKEITIRMLHRDWAPLQVEIPSTIPKKKRRSRIPKRYAINEDILQQFLNEKIGGKTRGSCNYVIRLRALKFDKSAHITGTCSCGSEMECFVERQNDVMVMNCLMKNGGKGACGKRNNVDGPAIQKKKVRKNISPNTPGVDVIDPQQPGTNSNHLDPDPMRAIEMLQVMGMECDLQSVRRLPVGVESVTNHQRALYKTLIVKSDVYIAIVSDRTMIEPMKRSRATAAPLTYYQTMAITSTDTCPVSQFISESSEDYLILNWLITWIESNKLSPPQKLIIQGNIDILTACLQGFSDYQSIDNYVDAFYQTDTLPSFVIRLDAVIILKKYAILMKDKEKDISSFFLRGIARLILCEKLNDAEGIARNLLIVASSPYKSTHSEDKSSSEYAREQLEHSMGTVFSQLDIEEVDLEKLSEADHRFIKDMRINMQNHNNAWSNLVINLQEEAKSDIEESPGTLISRFYDPNFAAELVNDLKILPLWTCIYNDLQGNENFPTSCLKAGAELNKIQQFLAVDNSLPIRLDAFLQLHKNYVDGNAAADQTLPENDCSDKNKSYSGDADDSSHVSKNGEESSSEESEDLESDDLESSDEESCDKQSSDKESSDVEFSDKKDDEKTRESNCYENWKNKAFIAEKKQQKLSNIRMSVPVLKQGNKEKLSQITISGQIIRISMACAFDAITQLFIAAAHSSPHFRVHTVSRNKQNSSMKMIHDVLIKGITDKTYSQRYELLEKIFGGEKEFVQSTGVVTMSCVSQVDETCQTLIDDLPCFTVTSACLNGCMTKKTSTVFLRLPLFTLLESSPDFVMIECLIYGLNNYQKCYETSTCKTSESYDIENDYFLLEVFGGERIKLSQLPEEIRLPSHTNVFYLRGLIHWDPPGETDESLPRNKRPVGHYSPYCKSSDVNNKNPWTHYDDCVTRCDNNDKVLPSVLLYTR